LSLSTVADHRDRAPVFRVRKSGARRDRGRCHPASTPPRHVLGHLAAPALRCRSVRECGPRPRVTAAVRQPARLRDGEPSRSLG